jgi:hypothetical protein
MEEKSVEQILSEQLERLEILGTTLKVLSEQLDVLEEKINQAERMFGETGDTNE